MKTRPAPGVQVYQMVAPMPPHGCGSVPSRVASAVDTSLTPVWRDAPGEGSALAKLSLLGAASVPMVRGSRGTGVGLVGVPDADAGPVVGVVDGVAEEVTGAREGTVAVRLGGPVA